MTASSAAIATHMSDGFVAMQCSLVPRIARLRFAPLMAAQPLPGSRLLHGISVARKYMQRVRWSRLPAVVAMFRSCTDAPLRIASLKNLVVLADEWMMSQIGVANPRTNR